MTSTVEDGRLVERTVLMKSQAQVEWFRGAWELLKDHKCGCRGEWPDISAHHTRCPKLLAHKVLNTEDYQEGMRNMKLAGNTWGPKTMVDLSREIKKTGEG